MQRFDAALARPAAEQYGLATREQLRDVGLTDEAIDRRIENGLLRPFHRGVLHHAATPVTHHTSLLAAVLACGISAAISHRSAGDLHGLGGIRSVRPELTVVGTVKPKVAGVTVHRTKTLDEADRTVIDRIPVTTPARTLLDLGAVLPYEVVERVVHLAVLERKVGNRDLLEVIDRVGKRGRPGTATLRAILRGAVPDERLDSMLEHDLLQLLERAGIPRPELQYPLICADGRRVVLDFAWPDRRVAIEADGHRWHATPTKLEDDNARRRSIRATGWALDAYGWRDVHGRPQLVMEEAHRTVCPSPS